MEKKEFLKELLINTIEKHFDEIYTWLNNESSFISSVDGYIVPEELTTQTAKEIFRKLRKAGLLDKNDKPKELSNAECGVLASYLAQRLDIEKLWDVFSKKWLINKETLRKGYYTGMKQPKTLRFLDKIKKILD